jgi:mycothiol synthase
VGARRVHGPVLTRPAGPADAERVLGVVAARDVADLGEPDYTLDDLRDEWSEDGFSLEHDSLVAEDDGGRLVAYACIRRDSQLVLVHPEAEGCGIGASMLEWADARAAARGFARRQYVASSNHAAARLLGAAGYGVTQHHWRMTMPLDGGLPRPILPEGVGLRTLRVGDEADERAVHAVAEDAFAEIDGNIPEPFEQWRQRRIERALFDPELFLVGERDGRVAGVALSEDWADEDTGYVRQLATSPRDRGIGLGRALLLASLAAFQARGRATGALTVNGGNLTAVRLYESVGMRAAWRVDRWDRPAA